MKHHTALLRTAIILLIASITISVNAQVQTAKYVSMCSNSNGYYEYLPQGYNSGSQTYPLIIFLHGTGELGDGNAQLPNMLNTGLPYAISHGQFPSSFTVNGQTFSFIVISPQFINWPVATDIDAVINYATSHYRVNTSRIYLTGLSMGGGAAWEYAGGSSTYANRLAALVPCAGASWPDMGRSRIISAANLPVWAFHNNNDPTVPSSYTTTYVSQINQAPSPTPLAKQTIFNASQHDCWTQVYNSSYSENGMTAFQWMLQYTKSGTGNSAPVVNAGTDQSITLPTSSVNLTGTASDQGGTITSYSWSEVSGAPATITSTSSPSTSITNLAAGNYTFRLSATDNQGATSSDDVAVTVSAPAVESPYGGTPQSIPGTIQAENFDNGGQNLAYYDYTPANQGGLYRPTEAVDIKAVGDNPANGYNIGWTLNGEWMKYTVNVATTGTYSIQTRIATPNSTTSIRVEMDGTTVATIAIPSTGGFWAWQTITTPNISLTQGSHVMRIYITTGSSTDTNYGVDIDYFTFTSTGSQSPPPTTTPYNGSPQSIPGTVQAENFDNGGQNLAYYDYTPANQGGLYRPTEAVDIKAVGDNPANGYNVGWTLNGEWMKYTVNVATTGTYSIQTRIATPNSTTSIRVEMDGTTVATIAIPSTGGFWAWQTITTSNVSLTQGSHVMRIYITTGSSTDTNYGVDIDYFTFTSTGSQSPPTTTPYNNSPQSIPGTVQAENFDNGGQNLAYYDYTSANQGGLYRPTEAVDIKAVGDNPTNGYNVGWTVNGEWMKYTVNVATTGTYSIQTRLATPNGNDSIRVEMDGTLVTTIAVPSTGAFWQWQTITTSNVSLTQGSHVMRIYITTSSATDPNYGVDIDYFTFSSSSGTTRSMIQQDTTATVSSTPLQVFPNPFQDKFTLQVDNTYTGTMSVRIIDINGNVQKQFSINKAFAGVMQTYLSAGDLAAGQYIINVEMTNWSQSTKVVKQ